MKQYILLFLACLTGFFVVAQEMNFEVTVNTPKLQTTDPKVFESLEDGIRNFLNTQQWTDDTFEPEERIKCNIQLTIREELSASSFTADLAIQAVRPIFGSSTQTVLLSHVDKDVGFTYEQYQPLDYSRNSYRDNLTSILSFYVYVILGMDYDSFSPFGGEPYYRRANDILATIPPGAASAYSGWRSLDGNRNRYWMIENIMSPKFRPFRQSMYDYHRQALDIMADDVGAGRVIIVQALDAILKVNRSYPSSMLIQMFANAKSQEIIEIFKNGTREQKTKVKSVMAKLDASNSSKYRTEIGR